tara:strand:+ start:400 stop:534 length:135 start_codon:yes stop_codon:yes gene_type:complete
MEHLVLLVQQDILLVAVVEEVKLQQEPKPEDQVVAELVLLVDQE